MSYLPKPGLSRPDAVRAPLAGDDVPNTTQTGRADLADWIELMEAVEALCPVWPIEAHAEGGVYKL
jgi:hypothetical protein